MFFVDLDVLHGGHRFEIELFDGRGLPGGARESAKLAELAVGDQIDRLLHGLSFAIYGGSTRPLGEGSRAWGKQSASTWVART